MRVLPGEAARQFNRKRSNADSVKKVSSDANMQPSKFNACIMMIPRHITTNVEPASFVPWVLQWCFLFLAETM
jgi:hypothetical protein